MNDLHIKYLNQQLLYKILLMHGALELSSMELDKFGFQLGDLPCIVVA